MKGNKIKDERRQMLWEWVAWNAHLSHGYPIRKWQSIPKMGYLVLEFLSRQLCTSVYLGLSTVAISGQQISGFLFFRQSRESKTVFSFYRNKLYALIFANADSNY